MLALEDARPCGERARWLKDKADDKLLDSLVYLEEVLTRAGYVAPELRLALDAARRRRRAGMSFAAAAYAFHSLFVDEMRGGEITGFLELAGKLDPDHLAGSSRVLSRQGSARDNAFVQDLFDRLMAHEHAHEYKTSYDARPPSDEPFGRSRAEVDRVLALLEAHDPETRAEIETLVSDILIIESDEINAGTSFRAHGLVLLRELVEPRDWTTYLENLVHEAAHLHLFLVWTQDPIFVSDPSVRRSSPLRRGERPLSGIFHAMFVLARTIRAVRLFAEIPELAAAVENMSTAYNNLRNPAPFEQKFEQACAALADAELTPVGQGLLEGCRRMVHGP